MSWKGAADALAAYVKSLSLYPEVSDGGAQRAQPVTKSISGDQGPRRARPRPR